MPLGSLSAGAPWPPGPGPAENPEGPLDILQGHNEKMMHSSADLILVPRRTFIVTLHAPHSRKVKGLPGSARESLLAADVQVDLGPGRSRPWLTVGGRRAVLCLQPLLLHRPAKVPSQPSTLQSGNDVATAAWPVSASWPRAPCANAVGMILANALIAMQHHAIPTCHQ